MTDEKKESHFMANTMMPLSLSAITVMVTMQAVESLAVLRALENKIGILTEVISTVGVCQKKP